VEADAKIGWLLYVGCVYSRYGDTVTVYSLYSS
jgi:hypothetical protein